MILCRFKLMYMHLISFVIFSHSSACWTYQRHRDGLVKHSIISSTYYDTLIHLCNCRSDPLYAIFFFIMCIWICCGSKLSSRILLTLANMLIVTYILQVI